MSRLANSAPLLSHRDIFPDRVGIATRARCLPNPTDTHFFTPRCLKNASDTHFFAARCLQNGVETHLEGGKSLEAPWWRVFGPIAMSGALRRGGLRPARGSLTRPNPALPAARRSPGRRREPDFIKFAQKIDICLSIVTPNSSGILNNSALRTLRS